MFFPAHRALIYAIFGAYLLLPVKTSFDFPGLPSLDKTTIPSLAILFCCAVYAGRNWLQAFKEPSLLFLGTTFVLSPFLTAAFNAEPLVYGNHLVRGMTLYDALSQATTNAITLIPFIAGFGLVKTDQSRQHVVIAFVVSAALYSLLMILEIRLSPQLHRWVYGYFPHSFIQQMRSDGFRPVVFMGHGLLVAIFISMAVSATIGRWRLARGRQKTTYGFLIFYLTTILVLCKSLGALILTIVSAPVLAGLRTKRISIIAMVCCIGILLYPAARASGLMPVGAIAQLAESVSVDRANSFIFRLENEDVLLEKALKKPMVGWGSWGRNRIYSDASGSDVSTTDGAWIIALGSWGWIGYFALFGILCLGVVKIFLGTKRGKTTISLPTATLSVILVINLVDSIPNHSIQSITWLVAGCLWRASIPYKSRRMRHIDVR